MRSSCLPILLLLCHSSPPDLATILLTPDRNPLTWPLLRPTGCVLIILNRKESPGFCSYMGLETRRSGRQFKMPSLNNHKPLGSCQLVQSRGPWQPERSSGIIYCDPSINYDPIHIARLLQSHTDKKSELWLLRPPSLYFFHSTRAALPVMISSAASERLELKGTVINELPEYNDLDKLFNIGLFIPYSIVITWGKKPSSQPYHLQQVC